jgi:uncharacterized protein (DUF697 family)
MSPILDRTVRAAGETMQRVNEARRSRGVSLAVREIGVGGLFNPVGLVGEALPESVVEQGASFILSSIDVALAQFSTDMALRADLARISHRDLDRAALERQLIRDAAWRSAARGAVSGLPAVVPGLGTKAEIGAATADTLLITVSQARAVLMLCHLRGLSLNDREARRLDVLLVLAMAAGAAEVDGEVIRAAGREIAIDDVRAGRIAPEVAAALVAQIASEIARRVSRRNVHRFVLRMMPGGVSVAAAAWIDWSAIGNAGRMAIRYLDVIAPVAETPASATKS